MIRLVFFILALAISMTTLAKSNVPNPCDNLAEATKELSWQQTETLLKSCRSNTSTLLPEISAQEASQWTDAAKGFAEALGVAAKELGIAANDFLDSPAGYLLAAILVFNYAGGAIIGVPFTIFTIGIMVWLLRRCMVGEIKYETVPALWGAFHYRRKVQISSVDDIDSSRAALLILSAFVLTLLDAIVWTNVA